MNTIPKQKDYKNLTPFDLTLIQKFPFLEDDFDSINLYGILNKIKEYLNTVIYNTIHVTENQTNLYNYVEDYFTNLDVQEEINNKLDEMVESGELEEIIAQYLNFNCLTVFNTVADMKNAENIITGMKCKTLGYYEINDKGAGTYLIRNRTFDDVIDNGKIILINENTVAELLVDKEKVNIKQFGAIGDGETDDTQSIQNAINSFNNIEGLSNEVYYISNSINVENKNLFNLNLKVEAFEVETGNTYRKALRLTGQNNLHNVNVESEFKYIPSIEIYADPTSENGLASNVQAFCVESGTTNFYECKADYCWAFYITGNANANIYNFIGTNLEMSLFSSSSGNTYIYNSKFTINKNINSIYYHHLYVIQGTNTKCFNCEFDETGIGKTGNHYHGYSTSFTDEMEVTGRLELNDCTLKTTEWCGQINGVNLIVNGGNIECSLLLTGGTLVDKPLGYFKNVTIIINAIGNYAMSYSPIKLEDCNIIIKGSGNKNICNKQYRMYNCNIKAENGDLGFQIPDATEEDIFTDLIEILNCNFLSNSIGWIYPFYSSNFKFANNTYTLKTTKVTSNPVNRGSTGYLYNCIFNNWPQPLASGETNIKQHIIADGQIISTIDGQ